MDIDRVAEIFRTNMTTLVREAAARRQHRHLATPWRDRLSVDVTPGDESGYELTVRPAA